MKINNSIANKNFTFMSSYLANIQYKISCKNKSLRNLTLNIKIPVKIFTILSLSLADIKNKISCKRYLFDKYDN